MHRMFLAAIKSGPDAFSTLCIVNTIFEFGPPSGAASNLGLTIVTLADFSDYYYDDYDGDFLYNYNGQDFFYNYNCLLFIKVVNV